MSAVSLKKREISSLLPFRIQNGEYEFYLQKREMTRDVLPGMLAMFGGGLDEGETPDEGLKREILEELMYVATNAEYFSRYEFATSVIHVYVEEVPVGFESSVKVCEGEYGTFIPFSRVRGASDISPSTQTIIIQAQQYLVQKSQ